ncbi:nuclear transport factor 2 family protein [Qipengyuania sp.]|uniref:nuclear transport factor 2 family protein n=1 Tax=Qipengyuania sp. TaxID=2004515 RepID=UPI0035C7F49F
MILGRSRREKALVERFVAAFNARDVGVIELLMTEDFLYIDSWREGVRGRNIVIDALRKLLEVDPEFRIAVETMNWRRPHMMMTGLVHSSHWGRGRRAVWQITVRDMLISEYQSWAEGGPPPLSRVLAPAKVEDLSATAPAQPPTDVTG